MITHQARPIIELPWLSDQQRQQVLALSQGPAQPFPTELGLHQLIAQQAMRTPDAIALVDDGYCLSYGALLRRARQLAHLLSREGRVPVQGCVALALPRSLPGAIALLAIWQAGGVCLPLDRAAPPQRIAQILEQTHTRLILTLDHDEACLHEAQVPRWALSEVWGQLQREPECQTRWEQEAAGTWLAYVLFTSGSTGVPKGVQVPHQAIVNRLCWGCQAVGLRAEDRQGQLSAWSFDIALWELMGPWLVGASSVLVSDQDVRDSAGLRQQLECEQISQLHLVPSLLSTLLAEEEAEASCWEGLRSLQCGGEAVSEELIARLWRKRRLRVHQYYGPTEAAISVTHWQGEPGDEPLNLALGRPIENVEIYVLDEQGQLVGVGVYGEIAIGGSALAWGYVGQGGQTAERFVPHPFLAGERLYRTGDRGRWRVDGQLEYAGRVDRQVKIRGHRVEPGEIEAHLLRHPAIANCAVVPNQERSGDVQLVGYVVGASAQALPAMSELRQYLQQRLPDYLVPAFLVPLDELPLTTNGKINRQMLKADSSRLVATSVLVDDNRVLPRAGIEELLASLWSELLRMPVTALGTSDSFFALGGHSLLAMQLVARIRTAFRIEMPLRSLFEAPTIAELASYIEQQRNKEETAALPPMVPVSRQVSSFPLSFAQQRLWFLDQLQPENIAYLIADSRRLLGSLSIVILEQCIGELIRRHESLRTTFEVRGEHPVQVVHPCGNYSLTVIDMSGLVQEQGQQEAHRLARQEAQRPCDLKDGPLWRTHLLRLHCEEHILLLTAHHIIWDGWSDDILRHELSVLYRAFEQGQPSPLAPLPLQYVDFAVWQRQWLRDEALQHELAYWHRLLSGVPPLELQTDHPRPPMQTYRGAMHHFALSEELTTALTTLSRGESVTLFMTLLAAFQLLLYRYSGQTDFAVGTDMANRTHVETEGLIGFFVNVVVLRCDLNRKPSFREVLQRVREMVLNAYAHQYMPFDLLVEKFAPQHSLDRMPLIQTLFVLQNTHADTSRRMEFMPQQQSNIAVHSPISNEVGSAKFDLALFMQESPKGLRGAMNYSSDLFEESTIATMMARFRVLLQSIIAQPDSAIDQLEFFTAEERSQRAREERQLRRTLRQQSGERFNLTDGFVV